MDGLPLHPALVHLPLGLAVILPFLAAFFAFAIRKAWFPRLSWGVIIALQLVTFASSWVAEETGEDERHRRITELGAQKIDPHEEWGEKFKLVAGVGLVVSTIPILPPLTPWAILGRWATVLVDGANLGIAYFTGHSGGQLVYGKIN